LCFKTSSPIKPRIVIFPVNATGLSSNVFHEFSSGMFLVIVGSLAKLLIPEAKKDTQLLEV